MSEGSISITAYTRTGETRKRLHVNVYREPNGEQIMSIRVGDVALYLPADDARIMASQMTTALDKAAAVNW